MSDQQPGDSGRNNDWHGNYYSQNISYARNVYTENRTPFDRLRDAGSKLGGKISGSFKGEGSEKADSPDSSKHEPGTGTVSTDNKPDTDTSAAADKQKSGPQ